MINGNDYITMYARKGSDREISGQIMADLLMDDTVSSTDMFDDLCYYYAEHSSKDYHDGMNAALRVLTTYDLHEIAEMVHKESNDIDEDDDGDGDEDL